MARKVFFSFYYDDIWRVNQIRNSWVTQGGQTNTFYDASLWEKAATEGDIAIKRLINAGLAGTSVTAVLIGQETAERRYVQYEIGRSVARGNGLLGIYIHELRDKNIWTNLFGFRGSNPFEGFYVDGASRSMDPLDRFGDWLNDRKLLSHIVPTYDWVGDDGYTNFARWVERAARAAGR